MNWVLKRVLNYVFGYEFWKVMIMFWIEFWEMSVELWFENPKQTPHSKVSVELDFENSTKRSLIISLYNSISLLKRRALLRNNSTQIHPQELKQGSKIPQLKYGEVWLRVYRQRLRICRQECRNLQKREREREREREL